MDSRSEAGMTRRNPNDLIYWNGYYLQVEFMEHEKVIFCSLVLRLNPHFH